MSIHPLRTNGRLHGALAVGSPGPLDVGASRMLSELAEVLSLRFDCDRLADECDRLRARSPALVEESEEKSEEVLKLSEALFAQDIELLRSNEKLGKIERLKNDFIEKMSRELRTPLNEIIEAIISVLTGENDVALRELEGGAALGARRRLLLPAHAPEHPRPVAHQAGRAARGDPGRQPARAGGRGDLQHPGLAGREAPAHRAALRRAAAAREDRPGQGQPDPVFAAGQRGEVHARGQHRDPRARARGPAHLQREGHWRRHLPGRPAARLRRVLPGRRAVVAEVPRRGPRGSRWCATWWCCSRARSR